MDRRLAQRPLDGRARYGNNAAGTLLVSILHPAARQARRGKKLLLERHVYSHRCHRVRQAPAERHGFMLTAPPLKGCGMQNAIHADPNPRWATLSGFFDGMAAKQSQEAFFLVTVR